MYSTANQILLDLCAGALACNCPLVLYLQLASIVAGEIQMQISGSIYLYLKISINDDSWGHQICRWSVAMQCCVADILAANFGFRASPKDGFLLLHTNTPYYDITIQVLSQDKFLVGD